MAFETNTLVNGEWTTRTLDVDAVLKHFNQKETNIGDLDIETAPTLGLLTQTVVRSPLAHWILQAKLRDPDRNDVAFIGVRVPSLFLSPFVCGNNYCSHCLLERHVFWISLVTYFLLGRLANSDNSTSVFMGIGLKADGGPKLMFAGRFCPNQGASARYPSMGCHSKGELRGPHSKCSCLWVDEST